MGAFMDLDFGRCQVYKLNLSACLTEREKEYYDLYCDGISNKALLERLGSKFYTPQMIADVFHITYKQAVDLLDSQLNKQYFKDFLIEEVNKFPNDKVREVKKSAIYRKNDRGEIIDIKRTDNRIVWFENECVRRCNADLKEIPLLDQFVILKCGSEALTDVLNQIIKRGVNIDGKHYLFYTSSTGQMKDAEVTLVEENYWHKNQFALMCGLTEERINAKGGINMGKFFSAKALNISNSKIVDADISIDEVIIVPDFKTIVSGIVNKLDVNTLDIEVKKENVPIEHMDGAGLFIPGVLPCSCQIRGGWLKGAVFPFDFHKFIQVFKDRLSDKHMIDAWGNPVSVAEFMKAKMILTDSQLKMRKYYDSMDEYRRCFKESGLSITINNCSHASKDEVWVAYQPLQTIPRSNLTDEAIKKVTKKTIDYINDAKTNPLVALKLMGIKIDDCELDNEDSSNECGEEETTFMLSPLHAAILKYPNMLNDVHVQKKMKSALISTRKRAQGCKLILDGTWSYICPDLYAFCEWLFLGEDVPKGLIPEGYIFNHYYDDKANIQETCCIRYPHLSDCEHAIRRVLRSDDCQEWFTGNDTIVSSHDLIFKTIQCDVDGDKCSNVHDKAFLDLLDRNQYPLYYEMTKAEPAPISHKAIMRCLTSSFFDNENIGYVSNSITKIFNSDEDPDIKLIRILCAFNNFVIDYFKTQKSMDLKRYAEDYESYKDKKSKCPWFFQYAKEKNKKLCEDYNDKSNCDRIGKYISNQTKEGISKIDYSSEDRFNPEILKDKTIDVKRQSAEYNKLRELILKLKLERRNIYKDIKSDLNDRETEKQIFNIYCVGKIKEVIPDRKVAVNYLVDIEYFTEENKDEIKDILWDCFGDILYDNLCWNISNNVDLPVRRNVYQSSAAKEKEIIDTRDKIIREQEELISVPVTRFIYDYMMDVKTRANRTNDKYIMFVLYVMLERFKKKNDPNAAYIRIYHGLKTPGKTTCATIDKMIGADVTKKGLIQLQKKGYIRIETLKDYDKVYLLNLPSNDQEVVLTAMSKNPLYDLWEKNGDKKIGHCAICNKKYVITGNTKTCTNERCSKILEKINKNKM